LKEMNQTEKVIVTGGAGFIGSHLTERLVEQGYQVIILDNLATGKKENIKELIAKNAVEFVQGSVTDLPLLKELFQGARYIFHLAALPSVPRSIENPLDCHQVNVTGTLNVLLAARENGARKVIYASSSSVYGDTPTLPKEEGMFPHPLSPYAAAKLAGEYYCQVFNEAYKLPTVCLRYFNVYGPRQDANSQYAAVIPRFIKGVHEGNSPLIFGDGEQTRDFTFVKDAVEATFLAAESNARGVFNIAGGQSITINELTELIIKLVGNKVKPVYQEPRPGDVRHSLADISRARAFGYEPKYSLEVGLGETVRPSNDR